jgi:hypothetical protein
MTFLDHLIDNLHKIAEQPHADGSSIITAKVITAKFLLNWLSPVLGMISGVLFAITNVELNNMLRTVYLSIAILFIVMSLIWAGWKNKQLTIEIIGYFKNGKKIKTPSTGSNTDVGHEIMRDSETDKEI